MCPGNPEILSISNHRLILSRIPGEVLIKSAMAWHSASHQELFSGWQIVDSFADR
jgi:hypothetical protein